MAVEIATAYVSLVPSFRGGSAAIARELNGTMSTAGSSAANSFASTAVAGFTRVGRRLGQVLGVGVLAAAGFGIKLAADFQQTTVAFEGMLGSAEKAKDMLKDLQQFAKHTPFSFVELTDISRRLLATGFAAEKILPTLTTLGDTAATLGIGQDKIEDVVRAFGQMRGKGKATAEELQQVAEAFAGFPVYDVLAKSLGKTTAQLFADMQRGAIPAEAAIAALLQGMGEFPGAAGAMERQNKTLAGQWSNFTDSLKLAAIQILTPWIPTFTGWLEKLASFINETLIPAVTKISDWVRNHQSLLGWLAVFVGVTLAVAFATWAASVIAATWPIFAIAAVVTGLAFGLKYAFEHWGWFREGVKKAAAEILILIGYIKDLIAVIGKIPDFLGLSVKSNLKDDRDRLIEKVKAKPMHGTVGGLMKLPKGDSGGVWPGPRGVHTLGWVAGGETLLPTHNGSVGMAASVEISVAPGADNDIVNGLLKYLRVNPASRAQLVGA